ncbi:hypothetical protein [Aerosakkonema funiforme]|uniref:hypothetical protein n=1 Tax=Aerosakkonema funiforme TaxID=1246630 RepID=UPI0035B7E67A
MIGDGLLTVHQADTLIQLNRQGSGLDKFQGIIYKFLLAIVKESPPEAVLREFRNLFIYQVGCANPEALNALYKIIFEKNEEEFRNTLKRSCYILINNWDASRNHKAIQELIQLLGEAKINEDTISPSLDRVKTWLNNFVKSKDYEDLKIFASRYDNQSEWAHRYSTFLLVPQYIDLNNPIEQREAARSRAKRLKDKFKFDLAMYTAHSQSPVAKDTKLDKPNPTGLGDDLLRLIKAIVAKRGPFSYANLASIFIKQTEFVTYKFFKQSLSKYLLFSVANKNFVNVFQQNISEKLEGLYKDHDEEILNDALKLRSCNRVIEYLTTENSREPAALFALLLSQGNPLTLVVILLKLILVSPNSRIHLEACIAALIQYYQKYPEAECRWLITFLEIFNITFAIYAENVEYNLIQMPQYRGSGEQLKGWTLDEYRIFSQLKQEPTLETAYENGLLE